jgi:hypothetical protein
MSLGRQWFSAMGSSASKCKACIALHRITGIPSSLIFDNEVKGMDKPIIDDELKKRIEPLLPQPKPRREKYPGRKVVSQ